LSNGELYTILTNKAAKGKKRSIVAMIAGTEAESVSAIIEQIPLKKRNQVTEITLDMAANMGLIAQKNVSLMPLVSQIGSMYKS
jgi:transposase